ncbi:MAG: YtxH domain-containing protein [Bryobacteraceae bacterium]
MQEENGGKLVWFLVGAAVGASVALLYAPASGNVTRRKLARTAQDGRETLEDSGRDMLDRGRELYEKGRKIADEAADMFERGRKLVQG